jgi:SAM-dependent methyltransferase
MEKLPSYTSEWRGMRYFLADAVKAYKTQLATSRNLVTARLEETKLVERLIRVTYGMEIQDLDMLEVGPGQVPCQLLYFSRRNRAVGIDSNIVLRRKTPLGIWRVARSNGLIRAIKTTARGILGIDASYYRDLRRQLDTPDLPVPHILPMDVHRLEFPGDSFDFVYSRSVFQHLRDPAKAIGEVRRVMRPGAITYISLHLYTSPNGYADGPVDDRTADWPHLRGMLPSGAGDRSRNKLRLGRWKDLFSDLMPGSRFLLRGPAEQGLRVRATELQNLGDLADYTLEELVNFEFAATWRKEPVDRKPDHK